MNNKAISIARLKKRNKRYQVSVDKGLVIRVQPSGVKSWVVRLPRNGRILDITIGHYPEISLAQAKQIARQKRQEYELEPPNGYTLKDAFNMWCGLKRGNIVTYRSEKGRIQKYIISKIGNKQIDEISAPMIIQLLKPLNDCGKRATLKRCLLRLREILDIAVCAGFLKHNPCPQMTRIFPAPIITPMPSKPWQELEKIIAEVLKQNNSRYSNLFLLSLCLLLRPKETASLRWTWIKDNVLTIPAEEMKMKRQHRVPLTDYALSLLDKIKAESKHKRSVYVFSGIKSNRHITPQTLANYMRKTPAFKGKLVAHGLRSIGRSWMADNGVDFVVAESCLAHVFGNQASRAYLRSDLLDARREVISRWNAYVKSCAESAERMLGSSIKSESCVLNGCKNC